MIRAFLSVELSQELLAELAVVQQELKRRIEPEMKHNTRISWARPASIHLTIKFLGDMDEQVIDPLRTALEQAIGNQMTVNVPLERLGAFPRPHSPRVLWVGPSENWERGVEAKRLIKIHGVIEQACEGLGFLREAKLFTPHLTLARIKMGERHVGIALAKGGVLDRPLSLGSLVVESVVLMRSELKPTGSVYTKLWEVTGVRLLSRPPNSAYAAVHGSTSSPRTVALKPFALSASTLLSTGVSKPAVSLSNRAGTHYLLASSVNDPRRGKDQALVRSVGCFSLVPT